MSEQLSFRLWAWLKEAGNGRNLYTPKQIEVSRDGRLKVEINHAPSPTTYKTRIVQSTVTTSEATILTAAKRYNDLVLRFTPLETGDIVVVAWLLPPNVSATADGYVVWRQYIGDVDAPVDVPIPAMEQGCKLVVKLEAGTTQKTSYALWGREV